MDDDLLYFNGINGATGDYLLPPMSPEELGRIALGEKWDPALFNELKIPPLPGRRSDFRPESRA